MNTIHVIDFEGNGELGITEFGVVTLRNFEITATETAHCLGDFHRHLPLFLSLRRSGLLGAHSAQTEDCLLRRYWASPGQVPSFFQEKTTLSWGPWVDTKLLYRRLFAAVPSYELDTLVWTFAMDGELKNLAKTLCPPSAIGFHNALFDALATALLIKNLRRHFSNVSIDSLVAIGEG
jgi:DNA polymerase III epsilon subunit-like protein